MDADFMAKFTAAPAGMKNHHAYQGGLLEHVVGLMELVLVVAPRYPRLDLDKLLIGAFLHDAAKVDELVYDRDIAYTDEGQLLGHMVLAMTMIDEKVREAERLSGEPFPKQLVTEIKHMVISHHGEYEYGSPKLPMTLEAVALHHLDNLDAKLASFTQLMVDCPNVESNWTQYHANLGRKLYKGEVEETPRTESDVNAYVFAVWRQLHRYSKANIRGIIKQHLMRSSSFGVRMSSIIESAKLDKTVFQVSSLTGSAPIVPIGFRRR